MFCSHWQHTPGYKRQKILSEWGKKFCAHLSVHTLEISYDVPEAMIEIILATTSNMNQIVQRIGRVLRKADGKDSALVYLVYVSDTKDDGILALVRRAVETSGDAEDNKIWKNLQGFRRQSWMEDRTKKGGPGGLRSHDFRLSSIEFRRQALYPCWATSPLRKLSCWQTVCMGSRKATRSFIKCLLDMALPGRQPIVDCTYSLSQFPHTRDVNYLIMNAKSVLMLHD